MQKIRQPIAKFLVFALTLSLFAGVWPMTLNALAASFLTGTVPSQVYLDAYLPQGVSGNAYIGWTVEVENHYSAIAMKFEDTYYVYGSAAYNGSYVSESEGAYFGYLSSTDLTKWTMLTTPVPEKVWEEGSYQSVQIPMNHTVVTPGGAAVARGGRNLLRSTDGLFAVVPPSPVWQYAFVDYEVARGDSLASIAKKHGVTVDDIKEYNAAYFADLAERNAAQKTNVPLEANISLTIPAMRTDGVNYKVQPGDRLWGIAWNYYDTMSGSKVGEIRNANSEYFKKTKNILEAGVTIQLPSNGIGNPVTNADLDQVVGIYRVKAGDTLGSIAAKYYGSTAYAGKIYDANKDRIQKVGNSYMIYEQQWLLITK